MIRITKQNAGLFIGKSIYYVDLDREFHSKEYTIYKLKVQWVGRRSFIIEANSLCASDEPILTKYCFLTLKDTKDYLKKKLKRQIKLESCSPEQWRVS